MPEGLHRARDYASLLQRFADRVAVADLSGTITYAALLRRAAAVGHRLIAAGVRPGDPVASLNRNAIPAVWASVGIHLAGAAEVALNANLAEADRRYCLQLAGVRHVVCAEAEAAFFTAHDVAAHTIETTGERPLDPAEFPSVGYADWAKIGFTSGTTGLPKGIVTDQRGRWVGNLLQRAAMPGRPGATGRLLLMTPFSHGAALLTYAYLDQGGSVMLLDGVDPAIVLPLIERGEVDEMFAPPTVLAKLVAAAEGRELRGLKVIYCGTAVLSPGLYARARAIFGPVIRVTYGKTEVINPICVLEPAELDEWYAEGGPGADACVGWPATGVEIVIDAGDGRNAAPGEAGEVLIRAQQMMAGFLRPSGYEKLDPGAFHESGDLGYLDARGRLHLVGRAADVIKTGGYKVAPEEVERALAAALGGCEFAVLGLPSEYWGEVIIVVAERPRAGWQEALQAEAAAMTGYKRPRLFLAVEDLPRNAMLKISRKALRERILGAHRLLDGPRPVLEPL
jgi:acyl-CoA synthetase (AMP-forming)/AMP-acid ligase II